MLKAMLCSPLANGADGERVPRVERVGRRVLPQHRGDAVEHAAQAAAANGIQKDEDEERMN